LWGLYPLWATKVRAYAKDGSTLSVNGVNDITSFIRVKSPFVPE
jgi:hypothetical protein